MLENLSKAAQETRYRAARNRLFYPEAPVPEPQYLLRNPAYQWEQTPHNAGWVQQLKKDAVRAANRERRIYVEDCIAEVCRYFGIAKRELTSARRGRDVVRPRQISMYVSRKMTPSAFPEIGRLHGDRDHTTVIHGVRKIEELTISDPRTRDDVAEIMHNLGWEQ